MGRFVVLSGPSCVGKGPLFNAIKRLHGEIEILKIVLYNDRARRLGEVDGEHYRFTTSGQIQQLGDNFIKVNLGSDSKPNLQALDLNDVHTIAESPKTAFLEAHYTIVEELKKRSNIEHITVFISPLSKPEIEFLKLQKEVLLANFVADVMRRKLLRRTAKQKGILSLPDLEDIEKRAKRAPNELGNAHLYDYVIPNHDGEDSDNWEQFHYPIGDARVAYLAFLEILLGRTPTTAEKWAVETFP